MANASSYHRFHNLRVNIRNHTSRLGRSKVDSIENSDYREEVSTPRRSGDASVLFASSAYGEIAPPADA